MPRATDDRQGSTHCARFRDAIQSKSSGSRNSNSVLLINDFSRVTGGVPSEFNQISGRAVMIRVGCDETGEAQVDDAMSTVVWFGNVLI